MQPAIEIRNLTKIYKLPHGKKKTALDCLSIDIAPGEIFGFLGPNGAGKTTTIKSILGFISPTSGDVNVFGTSTEDPAARKNIGYLPEQPYFHKFMTPTEIVSMHAVLAGIPRRERKSRVLECVESVGLAEQARTPASKLSKGQVQRIGVAQALVGNPSLLILDEPGSGLDPLGRRQIRDLLLKQKEIGRTVFVSSHLLSEIETVCDRVAVLSRGKLVALGTPDEVKQQSSRVTVTTSGAIPQELVNRVADMGAHLSRCEGEISITLDGNHLYELIDDLKMAGLPLVSVAPERETLEDAFLRLAA